jgi:hypothetical protein
VREGVCTDLARAARADCATVVADIGRGAGPPLELVGEATLVVVVARTIPPQLAAAGEHARLMEGLVGGRCPVRVCLTGTRLRDEMDIRLASAAHGFKVAARLPLRGAGEDAGMRSEGALAALLGAAS